MGSLRTILPMSKARWCSTSAASTTARHNGFTPDKSIRRMTSAGITATATSPACPTTAGWCSITPNSTTWCLRRNSAWSAAGAANASEFLTAPPARRHGKKAPERPGKSARRDLLIIRLDHIGWLAQPVASACKSMPACLPVAFPVTARDTCKRRMTFRRTTNSFQIGETTMLRMSFVAVTAVLIGSALVAQAQQQAPAQAAASAPVAAPPPPPRAPTKVADNVYIFRYVGHQSMFIVTPAGVIAPDPISLRRPAKPYIAAIQAVTKAPIKYVIYSHSHFDHSAGGQPFKDLGATFVAQRNAKARIQALKPADVVVPDQVVDDKKVITLGGTTLELLYLGKNHSDSTLVMRLPKEKIIFTVDWIPIQGVQFREMADTYIPDIEDGLKKVIALDWETLIPGHPGPGGKQTGTKDNARDQLAYLQDLSAAVKQEVAQGKSYDDAVKDISLPKYAAWPNYKAFLPMNIERYYDFWNRGI